MKNLAQRFQQHLSLPVRLLVSTVLIAGLSQTGLARTAKALPVRRIAAEINSNERAQLPDSKLPQARAEFDSGRLAAGTRLEGITIYFSRTESQEAALQALIAAQLNPRSPEFHQWLTPEQFAGRFGMADADLTKVKNWLEQQGFSIDSVARGKDMIRFSGTARQVESAFSTEMHNYNVPTSQGVKKHFAPSTALSVPAALAGVVQGIHNLDDFRPHSHIAASRAAKVKPSFTSSQTGSVFFAPGDVATVYDVTKEYNAGYTGAGQTIAIVGQSAVDPKDLENFQSAAGLTIKDPTMVLVPGSGTSTVYSRDESESDIDLEWSGAIGKGAQITFVYVGDDQNSSIWDSLTYAIDNQIGTIISSSYGLCEAELGGFSLELTFEKAAVQGQTVISASGDSGSTDCFQGTTTTNPTLTQQEALAVDYPASSPYVTGVGGTEISTTNSAYMTAGSAYWEAEGSSDEITSALQYIPEQVWNEDGAGCGSDDCLYSGGGGASALFPKPSWQTGVAGSIPSANHRYVPDISLNASTGLPGYLLCTSDTSFWSSDQTASCNQGFRDSSTGDLTLAGGTSFAAPIFAGMLALVNQQQGYTTGQGLVNPTLYTLASDSATYASAFNDITTGSNDCLAGSGSCNGQIGFSAGTGYDEASGLGSLDLFNLAGAWTPNATPSQIGTTTTVSASSIAPVLNATDTFTVTVASDVAGTTPSGNITITVDSNAAITEALTSNGTYVYTASFSTAGFHQVLVAYAGDATHASSVGSASVNVPAPTSGTGTFALSATSMTVAQGSVGTSSVTVTPSGGYTGTVAFSLSTTSTALSNDTCPSIPNALVSGTVPVTVTFTLDTNAATCSSTGSARKGGKQVIRASGMASGGIPNPIAAAGIFVGLLLAGFLGRYSRKLRMVAGVVLLAGLGMAFTGCGGSNNGTTVTNVPKGTYTITITGNDTSTATITNTTTLTVVVN